LCHCGFSSNSWREVCKNENEYTFVGWVSAKCFAVETIKDNLSDNVIMATLSVAVDPTDREKDFGVKSYPKTTQS
jgi:hypothetical protein